MAKKSEIKSVTAGVFECRTLQLHEAHLKRALETASACCGVKRDCILSKNLSRFHVTAGYPPDVAHDLLEGITPMELAFCFSLLISKIYLTSEKLNNLSQNSEYKWAEKNNRQYHRISQLKKNIGGKAHKNWSLLQLLPLILI